MERGTYKNYSNVQKEPLALQDIPEKLRTKEIYELAIEKDPLALQHVPVAIQEQYPSICAIAVKKNPLALRYVAKVVQISYPLICQFAVERFPLALRYVAKVVQESDPSICQAAVAKEPLALQHIPEKLRTKEIYELAIEKDPLALQHVPVAIQEEYPSICQLAIARNPLALQYVPVAIQEEYPLLCELAIEKDPLALQYIPKGFIDNQLYATLASMHKVPLIELLQKLAIANATMLNSMPLETLKTEDAKRICELAIEKDPLALQYVPVAIQEQYPSISQSAVQGNALALQYIPEKLRTKEICQLAIEKDPLALQYVPKAILKANLGIIVAAIKLQPEVKNPMRSVFAFVPPECLTEELWEMLAANNDFTLHMMPNKFKNAAICRAAVKTDPMALGAVPSDIPEYREICELAVAKDPLALGEVESSLLVEDELSMLPGDKSLWYNCMKKHNISLEELVVKLATESNLFEKLKELSQRGYAISTLMPFRQFLKSTILKIFTLAATDIGAFQDIPLDALSIENQAKVSMVAVTKNPLALQYVPLRKFPPKVQEEISLIAVQQDPLALQYVPRSHRQYVIDRILEREIDKLQKLKESSNGKDIIKNAVDKVYEYFDQYCRFLDDGSFPDGKTLHALMQKDKQNIDKATNKGKDIKQKLNSSGTDELPVHIDISMLFDNIEEAYRKHKETKNQEISNIMNYHQRTAQHQLPSNNLSAIAKENPLDRQYH